jgi:hypothetical protein
LAAFALTMLATVTFDGFLETPLWSDAAERLSVSSLFTPPGYDVLASLALITFAGLFAALFLLTARLMAGFANTFDPQQTTTTGEMAGLFVLTLVPIAIGYHLAHYLSFLLIAGQFAIPLISDPLGWGWDLFGTTLYFIDIGVVGAKFVWYFSVVAIVTGHVVAVWLAHLIAARRFASRAQAIRSQYPLLALMLAYTATSLWILAQPITEPAASAS